MTANQRILSKKEKQGKAIGKGIHLTFNQGVMGSSPIGITTNLGNPAGVFLF
jgi:hypothetical protein